MIITPLHPASAAQALRRVRRREADGLDSSADPRASTQDEVQVSHEATHPSCSEIVLHSEVDPRVALASAFLKVHRRVLTRRPATVARA